MMIIIASIYIFPIAVAGVKMKDLESSSKNPINLLLTINVNESLGKNILLRLLLGVLESTECYTEVVRVCEDFIQGYNWMIIGDSFYSRFFLFSPIFNWDYLNLFSFHLWCYITTSPS